MVQGEWVKMEDTGSFRAGEMRSQRLLSFGFSVIELGRNKPLSRGNALRNAEAEVLMVRFSNILFILENLDYR